MKKRNNKLKEFSLSSTSKILCSKISSKNHNSFISGDDQNNINLWNFNKDTPQLSFSHQSTAASINIEITSLIYDFYETLIYSGSNRGIINVYDIASQKQKCTLKGHTVSINSLAFFPLEDKNHLLVSGSSDNSIKLWDLRQKQSVNTWKGHNMPINTLDCSSDGKWIVSGAQDELIKIWDLNTWKQVYSFNFHQGSIINTKFHPFDINLVSTNTDKIVRYWGLEKFNLLFETKADAMINNKLCFSDDGNHLFTASNDSLKVWDLKKQGVLLDNVESNWKGVLDIVYNDKDQTILGVNYQSNLIKLWSTDIKSINLTEEYNKRKSSCSVFRPRCHDKENSNDSNKGSKLGFINPERRMSFIGGAQKILQQKNIDINLNKVLDPNQTNSKFNKQRSQTPKDYQNQRFTKNSQNQNKIQSPMLTKTLSSEYKSTPQEQKIDKRAGCVLNHLKERGINHQKIDEVSAENECSIMNMQKCFNEEFKMNSFLIDKESSDKCIQYDLINELSNEHSKFSGIISTKINYLKPILNMIITNDSASVVEAIKSLKHNSLLLDAFNILSQNNFLDGLKMNDYNVFLEKCPLLLESRYEFHIKFGIDFIRLLITYFIKNKRSKEKEENSLNFIKTLQNIMQNSRFEKLTKYDKNIKIKDFVNSLKDEILFILRHNEIST